MDWRKKVALTFLRQDFISMLLGRSHVARKARALIMHDQILTGYPRDR